MSDERKQPDPVGRGSHPERTHKGLSKKDKELIHELYWKIYCLMYSRKTIEKMANEDIKRRKWYEKP